MADKIPSNIEVHQTLEKAREEIKIAKAETEGLTPVGEKILDDTQQVLRTAQQFIREKNPDDKLQQLAKESELAAQELAREMDRLKNAQDKAINEIDSQRLKELLQRTMETARFTGQEILGSASFRRSIKDFVRFLTDIMSDSVKDTGRGIEDELSTDRLQGKAQQKGQELKERAKREGIQQTAQKAGREAMDVAQDVAQKATEKGRIASEKVRQNVQKPGEKLMRGEGDQTENVRKVVEGGINPVLEAAGVGKRVKLSDQQLDELWNRFNNIIKEITERENSKRVVNGILEVLRLVREQMAVAKDNAQYQLGNMAENLKNADHIWNSLELSKEVFERVTGCGKIDGLFDRLRSILDTINNDPEVQSYFYDLRDYLQTILDKPERLRDNATIDEGKRFINRARDLQNQKLVDDINGMLDELNKMMYKMEHDPLNIRLKEDMKNLVADLAMDSEGNFVFKPEVLDQLKLVIVKSLVERVQIPLAPIRAETDTMEYELSGLLVNLKDILPDRVLIESRGKVLLDPKQMELEGAAHGLRIVMNNINVHMPSSRLWFRRKTFPKIEDEGYANIDIGGRGLDIIVTLRTFTKPPNFFRVLGVECNVHNLSLNLSDTRHDYIYNTLLSMFKGSIKRDIEKSIENNIHDNLEQLNDVLRDQMQKAQLNARPLQETIKQGLQQTMSIAH